MYFFSFLTETHVSAFLSYHILILICFLLDVFSFHNILFCVDLLQCSNFVLIVVRLTLSPGFITIAKFSCFFALCFSLHNTDSHVLKIKARFVFKSRIVFNDLKFQMHDS